MYSPINSHSLSLCRHTHEHLQLQRIEYITPDPEVSYYMLYNTELSLSFIRLDGRRRRSYVIIPARGQNVTPRVLH